MGGNNYRKQVDTVGVALQELSSLQEAFCQTYVRTLNAGLAYREAYKCAPHVSAREISSNIKTLLRLPYIVARIESLRMDALAATNVQLREIIVNWYEIATADPHEIMSHRRVNCRYCRGVDHKYQWKEGELWEAQSAAITAEKPMPDIAGGTGYVRNLEPLEDCPECEGEGVQEVFFADTTKLEGKARKLFKGVRVNRNGTEILLHDQHAAAETLARLLGAFPDIGKPDERKGVQGSSNATPSTPQEAGKAYLQLIQGGKKGPS